MRFHLLDRILTWESEKSLQGIKRLTGAEEYLLDHFPGFPIMPGVLQLQALVEAASWLVRLSEGFGNSVVVLREVKTAKFASMIQPGKVLELAVDWASRDSALTWFKGKGAVDGVTTVQAQFGLASYSLRDRYPALAGRDEELKRYWQDLLPLLQMRATTCN